jgi:hypothetical protein
MGQALIIDIEGESGEASRETSVEESRGDWSGPLPKNRIAIETR